MKRTTLFFFVLIYIASGIFTVEVPFSVIRERVEKTGRLKLKNPVNIRYVSSDEFKKYIEDYFSSSYPEDLSEKEGKFLFYMGFSEKDISVKEWRRKLIVNHAGGLYDEKNGQLLSIRDLAASDPVFRLILVHELRHAVQDQNFDISGLLGNRSDFDDRRMAVTAALEGDAMLVMALYSEAYTPFPLFPDLASSGYNSDALLSFSPVKFSYNISGLPAFLKRHLSMPYMHGMKFVYDIFRKKGWKGVNGILLDPPVSTEQILHPAKYLKRERPVIVDPVHQPPGYDLYHSGTVGEYMLNVLLMTGNDLSDRASGWGGDGFKIYIKGDRYCFLWKSVWDREEDCSSFFSDFRNFSEAASGISYSDGNISGKPFIAGRSRGDYFFLRRFSRNMFFMRTNDREEMNNFINGGYYD